MTHMSMANLPGSKPLRKMTLPSLDYINCPQLFGCWSGLKNPFTLHARMTGLILCWQPEFLWVQEYSSPVMFRRYHFTYLTFTSYKLSASSSSVFPEPWWKVWCSCPICSQALHWRSFSALWPVASFCVNYYPPHKETSLWCPTARLISSYRDLSSERGLIWANTLLLFYFMYRVPNCFFFFFLYSSFK